MLHECLMCTDEEKEDNAPITGLLNPKNWCSIHKCMKAKWDMQPEDPFDDKPYCLKCAIAGNSKEQSKPYTPTPQQKSAVVEIAATMSLGDFWRMKASGASVQFEQPKQYKCGWCHHVSKTELEAVQHRMACGDDRECKCFKCGGNEHPNCRSMDGNKCISCSHPSAAESPKRKAEEMTKPINSVPKKAKKFKCSECGCKNYPDCGYANGNICDYCMCGSCGEHTDGKECCDA